MQFCRDYPEECARRNKETLVTLTPLAREIIEAVNRSVNESIKPATDEEHWGRDPLWTYKGV